VSRSLERAEALLVSITRGRRVAVVGVGNRLRGDDGAGSWLAERLRARCGAPVFDAETVPENYLGPLLAADPEVVLFVDAARLDAPPGACRLVPAHALGGRCDSTHGMSLLLLSRALEAHGIECWLFGLQPARTSAGEPVSPEVAAAARALEDVLAACLPEPEAAHA
jgi:hydrogenase 3 maturation protease